MSSSQPENRAPNEQRSSYRCAVSGSRRHGRLTIGDRELAVEILNESASGFSVVLDEASDCAVGVVGILKSAAGWAEVEIKNLQLLGPAASEESADAEPKPRTRLGLLRLRTLEESDAETELSVELPWLSLKTLGGFFGALARPLISTAGVTIGALVLGILLIYGVEQSIPLIPELDLEIKKTTGHKEAAPPPLKGAAPKKWHVKLETGPTAPQTVPQVTTSAKEPSVASGKAARKTRFDDLRAVVENPDIRELPWLSREQIRRLRNWIDDYRTRARNADVPASKAVATQSPQTAGRSPDSRLEFLTEEQHRTLLRLLSKPESAEDPATPDKRPVEAAE